MFKILFYLGLIIFILYGAFSFIVRYLGRVVRQNNQGNQRQQQAGNQTPSDSDKHFTKDVGEYVSYEEVKDEDRKS